MLHFGSRWHFAFERDPEKEGRLLGFAGYANTPSTPDPLPEESAFAPKEGAFNPKIAQVSENIQQQRDAARAQAGAVLADDSPIVPKQLTPEELKAAEETRKKKEEEERIQQENEIKGKNTMRQKMEQVLNEIKKEMDQMKKLKKRMQEAGLLERLHKYADKSLIERWTRDIETLEREEQNTAREMQFAEAIQQYWEGEIPPSSFLAEQGDYMKNLPYGFDELGDVIHLATRDITQTGTIDTPLVTNESSRIQAFQLMRDTIQIDDWVASQATTRRKIKKLLDTKELWVEGIEKQSDVLLAAEIAPDTGGLTKALSSIRFYSINNYIHGIQKYWAALKSTLEQRSERYDADIARNIGRTMKYLNFWPVYGEEVDRILDQQLEAKSSEETEAMKKQLGPPENTRWADMFGENPKWNFAEIAYSNPNKARGILEYAAEHGFLYEIDEAFADPEMRIYGIPLGDICSDWRNAGEKQKITNYFSSLRSKNASGRESEIKSGKETVHEVDNIPQFIEMLSAEMDDLNLWSTVGICDRAMERGLLGEVSPWLLTTIMEKLRQHPELRKRTPSIFFDLVGKLGMYKTGFSLGWAKAHRRELREWAISGDEKKLESTAFTHFVVIENDIRQKDPSTDYDSPQGKKDLARLIAQVLACQIVELPGGYLHIYQSKFKEYRKEAKDMFAAVENPHKEDTDFALGTTEKPMLPVGTYDEILAYTSTREFENKKWVEPFLTSMIRTARELDRIPELREAHANYCEEVSEKMNKHFKALLTEAQANKQLGAEAFGKPAIAQLVVEGLLSWDKINTAPWAGELEQQLRDEPEFFDFYSKNIAVRPAGQGPQAGGAKSDTKVKQNNAV